ncbi:hypothetical protein PTKIN_Ptkin02bG0219400 [Pterospermum kingtungense]
MVAQQNIHENRRLPGPDQTSPACWLVNIRDDGTDLAKVGLLKPLLDSELKPLPTSFPKVLDLTNFQVIELGHQFVAQFSVYFNHPWDIRRHGYQSREKTAFLWSNTDSNDYVMFTVLGRLVYFRSGEKEWGVLENVGVDVADIISFNGKFYVIERNGRTMVVDQSLKVTFLQHVGSAASRKYLVQSAYNLLTVEMLFLPSSDSDDALTPVNSPLRDTVVGFRIFRLDEEAEKWDKMESLGDQILFLGLHQSISASAYELYWGKGNLIFYSSDEHLFVFDLDTATACPLEKCPAYSNLFWPPPEWVTSPQSVISSGQVRSNSTDSVTSATPDVEYKHPDSNLTISAREFRCKSPERLSSARQDFQAMADWSQLPLQLITLIAKCLEPGLMFSGSALSAFHGVPPFYQNFTFYPKNLPSETRGLFENSPRDITTHTFFLVRFRGANRTDAACWVFNIGEYTKSVKMRLLKPLSDSELKPLPVNFPKVLDLTNFQVVQLGQRLGHQLASCQIDGGVNCLNSQVAHLAHLANNLSLFGWLPRKSSEL